LSSNPETAENNKNIKTLPNILTTPRTAQFLSMAYVV
jgi:hypothetical protein